MSGGKKRFLDPAVLAEAVEQVGRLAAREQVRVALIGGFALQFYGSDRLTGDIDLAASHPIDALPPGPTLSFGGVQTSAPNGVPVDLVLRDDDFASLYEDALAKAVRIPEISVPVARPEHLAAMKMVAGRARDNADLEFLILSDVIDATAARRVIRQHLGPYAAREFGALAEEIRWRASRAR